MIWCKFFVCFSKALGLGIFAPLRSIIFLQFGDFFSHYFFKYILPLTYFGDFSRCSWPLAVIPHLTEAVFSFSVSFFIILLLCFQVTTIFFCNLSLIPYSVIFISDIKGSKSLIWLLIFVCIYFNFWICGIHLYFLISLSTKWYLVPLLCSFDWLIIPHYYDSSFLFEFLIVWVDMRHWEFYLVCVYTNTSGPVHERKWFRRNIVISLFALSL